MKITSFKRKNTRVARSLSAIFVAIALVLSISTGTSLAFTTFEGLYDDPSTNTHNAAAFKSRFDGSHSNPPSASADVCLPLLKTIHHTPSASALDRNQRSAGKVAALGLVFGVRFALSPPEATKDHARYSSLGNNKATNAVLTLHGDKKIGNNRSALSVSAYRQCQKQQALKALSMAQ